MICLVNCMDWRGLYIWRNMYVASPSSCCTFSALLDIELIRGQIARPAISPLMVDVDRLHLLQDKAFHEFEKSLVAVAAV